MLCQFCDSPLSGRQRTTCADCRKKDRHQPRPSGYARLTEEQREDRSAALKRERDTAWGTNHKVAMGIDGEGHKGSYFLLAAADEDGNHWERWSDHPRGLSTVECFEFLLSLPKHYTKWGFYFGYDINMMLRDVYWKTLQTLHRTGCARWNEYRLTWKPGKQFIVSRYPYLEGVRRQGERCTGSVTIWDMYPWYASSFVKYLKDSKLADEETISRIASMKERRSDFDPTSEREEITAYCLDEVRLLAKGANQLHDMITGQDVRISQFFSPASISKYLMRQNRVHEHMTQDHPAELRGPIDAARFGGRAELVQAGPVEGPLYQYDIRSAYPTAMLELPCWAHGHWDHAGESLRAEASPWTLMRVRWKPRPNDRPLWGPFPVRPRTGSLKWPTTGEGWFWQAEVAGVAHLASIKVLDTWTWVQDCVHRPFEYLRDLYAERLALKAAGDRREYVNKIALNASYGATAESPKRANQRVSPWREVAWAGMITAQTRGTVGAQLGPSVIMVATDAVVSTKPLDLPLGRELGEWEAAEYERGLFVGPGVYFLWRDGAWATFKSRGISAKDIHPDEIEALWDDKGREGAYSFDQTRFVGLGTALHRVNGLPPPEDAETVWRQFVEGEVRRSLSLFPRREWLSENVYDGRTRAPSAKTVKDASFDDMMRLELLREKYRRATSALEKVKLADKIRHISSDDPAEQYGTIFDEVE